MTFADSEVVAATPRDVATRLGHELDRLGTLADNMQSALATLRMAGESIEAMQSLDLMTQSLFVLSSFLAEWALVLDGTAAVNIRAALARISLADVGHRLAATGRAGNAEARAADADGVEMFEDDV